MIWKFKAHTLAVLSRMPGGSRMYHKLQQVAGTNRLNLDRDLTRAYELVELTRSAGGSLSGVTCVEVGTGWRPFVPFVLALAGAGRVVTIDVNPWLTLDYARESWRSLASRLDEIAAYCDISESEVRQRYARVNPDADSLGLLFAPLGIEYVYPGDARDVPLPTGSVDLVVSSNVLEHIPREIQQAIHSESHRLLRSGGLAVHRFNPQDHYSTVDGRITNANFLKYSSRAWHWYGGSGLAYHNRLRSRDYYEMFAQAGLDVVISRERTDEPSLAAIRDGRLRVHPDFRKYSPEELAVDYMWLACRKPQMEVAVPSAPAHSLHSAVC